MSAERDNTAKELLTRYYRDRGVLPSVQTFAELMGYTSTSSAHYTLSKLVEQGFLGKEDRGGRLMPGPAFDRRAATASARLVAIPDELRLALPAGVELTTLVVDDRFNADEAIWPGDMLVLAPAARTDLSELLVLRRGGAFVTAGEPRSGWSVVGVLVAQFRSFGPKPHARPPGISKAARA